MAALGSTPSGSGGAAPKPGMSSTITSRSASSNPTTGSQTTRLPPRPWRRSSCSPSPAVNATPAGGLREERLHVADPALAEARLGGAQVEGPEPAEALVVAARAEPVPGAEKALAPGGEGERIVGCDVLRPDLAHLGVAGEAGGDLRLRGEAAAGEDVGVGEAARPLLDLVEAVVDRDRLQQHQPVRAEQLVAAAEELVEVPPADGLDHLDRDEAVVAAAQVAVVLEQHGDPVLEPGFGDPALASSSCSRGDRRRRHPAAVLAGRVDRQAAPARADLQQVVAGTEAQPPADALQLLQLRLLQARALAREVGAGIDHPLVEEGGEEVVAEVVVGGDVAPRPAPGCSRGRAGASGAAGARGRATAPRRPSSWRSSRAPIRIRATRSSVSQSPST